jgi:hypothetical protein
MSERWRVTFEGGAPTVWGATRELAVSRAEATIGLALTLGKGGRLLDSLGQVRARVQRRTSGPSGANLASRINLRASEAELVAMKSAARRAGETFNAWARAILVREAEK